MKTQMVTTNLRMEKNAWRQVKAAAGELGVSVNGYLNALVWEKIGEKQLGINSRKRKDENKFWDIPKIMKSLPSRPMGLSEEDEIIYG